MKEYVLIFRINDPAFKPTPEQLQERMNWLAGIAAQNKLADKGQTLSVTGAVTLHANDVVTDGPFTELREFISGFVVIRTDTIGEAIELAKRNPVFKIGGSIEIREVVKR